MSSEEKPAEFDFASKRNGEEDDDIFKSAVHTPMMESEQAPVLHGSDEIDLNDEDDDTIAEDLQNVHKPNNVKYHALDDDDDEDNSLFKSTMDRSFNSKGQSDSQHTSAVINKPYQQQPSMDKGDSNDNDQPHDVNTNSSEDVSKSHGISPESETAATISTSVPQASEVGGGITKSTSGDVKTEKIVSRAEGSDNNDAESQFIEITVTEPQKQGDGMSGFVVYRVATRTNIALFRRKEFAVWRRFSDFLGLHQKLAEKFLRKGRIVPPAPEKNVIGKIKIGQAEANSNQSEFLEKRRASLERFINRTAAHSTFRVDPDFRDFLEIDSDLPKSTSTSAFSGAGVARLFSKFGEQVNKISYKMDESDPWFEEKIQNIEALENQLRKVHASLELLVANRKELASATGTFAKSSAILSNQEEHTALARALAQLAETEEKVELVHNEQGNSDFYLFSELLKDYIGLIGAVKDVFHERVKANQTWQHAQQTLNKKREAKARLELQVRNDKIGQAREEVVEWESRVEKSHEEFILMSSVIKKELEQFELARVKDFKKVIVKYLESLLTQQQELVKYWEAFLPEAQAIN